MAVSVYPERMDQIDPEDVESSLRTIESYIHYMTERTEFALTNTFRTTNGLGSSAQAVALVLQETVDNLSALNGQVGSLSGDITDAQADIQAMHGTLAAIYETIGQIGESIDSIQTSIDSLNDAVSDLDTRVTALENPEPEPEPDPEPNQEGGN